MEVLNPPPTLLMTQETGKEKALKAVHSKKSKSKTRHLYDLCSTPFFLLREEWEEGEDQAQKLGRLSPIDLLPRMTMGKMTQVLNLVPRPEAPASPGACKGCRSERLFP